MFDAADTDRLLLAWIEAPVLRKAHSKADDEPDLRLLIVTDDETRLFVEVADGAPCPNGTMLWVEDRGSFRVAGVLSREGPRGSRSYMRLLASKFPTAA